MYDSGLKDMNIQHLNHISDDNLSSCHLYITRLLGKSLEERNEFIEKLAKAGVPANVHYQPLSLLSAYKNLGFDIKDYPNAYDMYKNEVTLPLHTLLSEEDVEYIILKIKENM